MVMKDSVWTLVALAAVLYTAFVLGGIPAVIGGLVGAAVGVVIVWVFVTVRGWVK